jgi:hypothetical protein
LMRPPSLYVVDDETVLRELALGQDGLVTLAQARCRGLTLDEVRRRSRAGRWPALARAVYRLDAKREARRARIRAVLMSFGPQAVAVLQTAAELLGIAGLPRTESIHVSLPGFAARAARPSDPSVVVHQLVLSDGDVHPIDGMACTTARRTVADLILGTERLIAVAVVDSALNKGLVTPDDLDHMRALLRGRRGAINARRYLTEADGRAASPLETRVRLRCVDGRVPPDDLQHVVRDRDGYVLAAADFAWVRARLLGEADGRGPHDGPPALYRDRRRQNLLIAEGWTVLRFTWSDTVDPEYVPAMVRSALSSARRS